MDNEHTEAVGSLRNAVRAAVSAALDESYDEFIEQAKADLEVRIFGDNGGEIHVTEQWPGGGLIWLKIPVSKAVENYIEAFKGESDREELYAAMAACFEEQADRLRKAP